MKRFYLVLLAAGVALGGFLLGGCSGEVVSEPIERPGDSAEVVTEPMERPGGAGESVTLTTRVGFDGATRALAADGTKTFAVGDQIAVIIGSDPSTRRLYTTEPLTAEDISDEGRTAVITVTLEGPQPGDDVAIVYPAAMADAADIINLTRLSQQDGTFETIASSLDVATFTGTLTAGAALPASVLLENRLAICELQIRHIDTERVLTEELSQLSVTDGTHSYTADIQSPLTSIFLALLAVDGADLSFNASDGTHKFTKEVSGATLNPSTFYSINLSMTQTPTQVIDLAKAKENIVATDGTRLTGILKSKLTLTIAAGATVTLDGVTIKKSTSTSVLSPGINCKGDATLILANGTKNLILNIPDSYPGIYIHYNNTLTIDGTGSLEVTGGANAAGIGGGSSSVYMNCGNITIANGTVKATGGQYAAGIGTGGLGKYDGSTNVIVGNITIIKGDVTAVGGDFAAAIGMGYSYPDIASSSSNSVHITCRGITIKNTVSRVNALKGNSGQYCIGKCRTHDHTNQKFTMGTITIGETTYSDGVGEDVSAYIYKP